MTVNAVIADTAVIAVIAVTAESDRPFSVFWPSSGD